MTVRIACSMREGQTLKVGVLLGDAGKRLETDSLLELGSLGCSEVGAIVTTVLNSVRQSK